MAEVSHVLARLRRQALSDVELVSDVPLTGQLNQLLADHACRWRDRLLPPLVTFRLFLMQVLHGNIAIAALRHLAGFDFAVSSYCEARQRLPLEVLQSLLQFVHQRAVDSLGLAKQIGSRILDRRRLELLDARRTGVEPAVRSARGNQARGGVPDRQAHGSAGCGHGLVREPAGAAVV